MKVKHFVCSIIVAAFLTSAMGTDKSLEIGNKAPEIETVDGTNVGYDANSEGKTKLVSFWNPKKADSRIANKKLSESYAGYSKNEVEFISICTDSDDDLMAEVLKVDGINAEASYAKSEIAPRVFKDFGVEENPKAFLISPQGKILQIL